MAKYFHAIENMCSDVLPNILGILSRIFHIMPNISILYEYFMKYMEHCRRVSVFYIPAIKWRILLFPGAPFTNMV